MKWTILKVNKIHENIYQIVLEIYENTEENTQNAFVRSHDTDAGMWLLGRQTREQTLIIVIAIIK